MTVNNAIKLLLAGMAFPAIFLPLAYTTFYLNDSSAIQTHPLQFVPMYLPLLFGLANLIRTLTKRTSKRSYWITGGILGLLVAAGGVYWLKIPEVLFGVHDKMIYLPFIFLPIVYAIIFRYIVNWLNNVLGV